MIPKKIHDCWFGGKPKPKLAEKCIASWKKYCPGYEIIEWNEENFDVNRNGYTRMCIAEKKYAFLSDYLRTLADRLTQRSKPGTAVYDPVVWVYGNRSPNINADRCLQFAGVGNLYYIVLCDGMGTGPVAVQEGKTAGHLLKGMLSSGFPAEAVLESLNSIWTLGERTGSVTVDLVQLELDTGKASLYKWGAAPSWLVSGSRTEKLGQPGTVPGLAVGKQTQGVCHLSMKKEQLLLLTSDGLDPERIGDCCRQPELTPAGLARKILACAAQDGDDATVVTIQLLPVKD